MIQRLLTTAILLSLFVPVAAQSDEPPHEPRLYELQSRSSREVVELLHGFVDQASISMSDSFNTLTVMTTPARHEIIRELIARFDVPPGEVEFQLYILRASTGGNGAPTEIPADVAGIVREIRALTRFDRFELLDAPVLRTVVGRQGGQLSGDGPFAYSLEIRRTSVNGSGESQDIRVGSFQLQFRLLTGYRQGQHFLELDEVTQDQRRSGSIKPVYREAGLETSFNIADGEKLVLGASRIQGSEEQAGLAIITVVEARILD